MNRPGEWPGRSERKDIRMTIEERAERKDIKMTVSELTKIKDQIMQECPEDQKMILSMLARMINEGAAADDQPNDGEQKAGDPGQGDQARTDDRRAELQLISLNDIFRLLNPEHKESVRNYAVFLLQQEQTDD